MQLAIGGYWGDLNERSVLLEDVEDAVNDMKYCKAPGLDGFPWNV